jgi:hypothetical protein
MAGGEQISQEKIEVGPMIHNRFYSSDERTNAESVAGLKVFKSMENDSPQREQKHFPLGGMYTTVQNAAQAAVGNVADSNIAQLLSKSRANYSRARITQIFRTV